MEITINEKTISTDPEGYLDNPEDWSPELAAELANRDGLVLTDDHWIVINYAREYFTDHGTAPNLRFFQKGLKEEHGDPWGDKKFLFELFPLSPNKQANRYAGNKKPTGCI